MLQPLQKGLSQATLRIDLSFVRILKEYDLSVFLFVSRSCLTTLSLLVTVHSQTELEFNNYDTAV